MNVTVCVVGSSLLCAESTQDAKFYFSAVATTLDYNNIATYTGYLGIASCV